MECKRESGAATPHAPTWYKGDPERSQPIPYNPVELGPRLPCPTSGLSQSRAHAKSLDKPVGHLEAVGARERLGTQMGLHPGRAQTRGQEVLLVI